MMVLEYFSGSRRFRLPLFLCGVSGGVYCRIYFVLLSICSIDIDPAEEPSDFPCETRTHLRHGACFSRYLMDHKIKRLNLNIILLILLYFTAVSCAPKHLGPEVRRDGVYFTFQAPAARNVVIAGSFNQWSVRKDVLAGPDNNGVWSITLPLPWGRYEYLFFVDQKEWKLDPGTAWVVDGFGGKNSVLRVEK